MFHEKISPAGNNVQMTMKSRKDNEIISTTAIYLQFVSTEIIALFLMVKIAYILNLSVWHVLWNLVIVSTDIDSESVRANLSQKTDH
jgi:hypothetical protein